MRMREPNQSPATAPLTSKNLDKLVQLSLAQQQQLSSASVEALLRNKTARVRFSIKAWWIFLFLTFSSSEIWRHCLWFNWMGAIAPIQLNPSNVFKFWWWKSKKQKIHHVPGGRLRYYVIKRRRMIVLKSELSFVLVRTRAGAIRDSIIGLRFKITNFEESVISDSNFL